MTEPDINHEGKCKYYATWVMNGPSYAILPNYNEEGAYYIDQFLEVLKLFWMNGGAVVLLAENEPFTYQTNLFLEMIEFPGEYKKANFRIGGNYKGGGIMKGIKSEDLINGSFNKKINICHQYERPNIGHQLTEINEGITLSYTEYDIKKLKPFIPFSRNVEGGVNAMFYIGEEGRGDIFIDCSYTKFLSDMKNSGTAKYIQNIGAWTANIEYHTQRDLLPSEYRPKLVEYKIDPNRKWNKFEEKPEVDPTKLKTLIVFDSSGSVEGKSIYFKKLEKIMEKFFKLERGDKIYKWSTSRKCITFEETKNIINKKIGSGGTHSHLIAEISNEERNNKFQHLVIVTDGNVENDEIVKGDNLMNQYNIKYSYVTTYIIKTGGFCDRSVGASFCRNCPNTTIYVDSDEKEYPQPSLTKLDIESFEKLDTIKSEYEFNQYSKNIENAIKAKTLGSASNEVKEKLNLLKSKIINPSNEFLEKWKSLYNFALKGNQDMSIKVC